MDTELPAFGDAHRLGEPATHPIAASRFERLKHRLALENTSGLSWLAAQQDFGAKVLADNLYAL